MNDKKINNKELQECVVIFRKKCFLLLIPILFFFLFPAIIPFLVIFLLLKKDLFKKYLEKIGLYECFKKTWKVKKDIKIINGKYYYKDELIYSKKGVSSSDLKLNKQEENNSKLDYIKQNEKNLSELKKTKIKKQHKYSPYQGDRVSVAYSGDYQENILSKAYSRNQKKDTKILSNTKTTSKINIASKDTKSEIIKTNNKQKYTYNNGKSIWDDYESVIK